MSLTGALSIASSGLNGIQYALSVTAQNVANANAAGYVRESAGLVSVEGLGVGSGVRQATTLRASDPALQRQNWAQAAIVSGAQVTNNSLVSINALFGSASISDTSTSAGTGTLSDLLGAVQNAFVTLSGDPTQVAAHQTVIASASAFASRVNSLSQAYQAQRQTAQDTIVAGVESVASDLATLGTMSDRIVLLRAEGADTADLENHRDAVMNDLSQYVSVQFQQTSTGDMQVRTQSGLSLPTRGDVHLSTRAASLDSTAVYPGAIPAITLGDRDVTGLLAGGTIGAAVTLRDTTLPTMQAQLDSLSGAVANRFSESGLDLFTTSSGTLPGPVGDQIAPSGQLGFAGQIEVNPAIEADPGKILSGTSATPAGSDVIAAVLDKAFGSTATPATNTGLGAHAALSTGYGGGGSLMSLAVNLAASQATVISSASSHLSVEQTVQNKLQTALSSATGVNVDDEMARVVALQNSYAANAKVISAVQSMFGALLNAVGA